MLTPAPSHGPVVAYGDSHGLPAESDMPRPPRDSPPAGRAVDLATSPSLSPLSVADIVDLLRNERTGTIRELLQMHALVRQVGWPTGVQIHACFGDALRPNVEPPSTPMTGQDPIALQVRQLDGQHWHYLPSRGDWRAVRSATEPFLCAVLMALTDRMEDAAWWTLGRLASDTRQRRFLHAEDPSLLLRLNINLAQSYEMNCSTPLFPLNPAMRAAPPRARSFSPIAASETTRPSPPPPMSSDDEVPLRKRTRLAQTGRDTFLTSE